MGPSFLDLQKTKDGKPYGPIRFKQLVRELYSIAKNTNTSYTDLLNITPAEKTLLIELILEDNKKSEEAMAKINEATKKKKSVRDR